MKNKKTIEVVLFFSKKYAYKYEEIPYSINIIEQGLREIGIEVSIYDFDKKRLRSLFKEDKPRIIAISSFFALYEETKALIKKFTGIPNTFIVIGGPITQSQEFNKKLFDEMPIDALCVGHCEPFLTFIKNVLNLKTKEQFLEKAQNAGLSTRQALHVKEGKFPKLKTFPLQKKTLDEEKKECKIAIPAMSGCPNSCDFCAVGHTIPNQMPLILIEVKKLIEQGWKITTIDFNHPTLNQAAFIQAKTLCSYVYELQNEKPYTELVLDSNHFSSKNYEKTIAMITELNGYEIQIGVNAVDEEMAKLIGRNMSETARTQGQIEDEMKGVIKFLAQPTSWLPPDRKLQGQIDLIISPFESYESLSKLTSFCNQVQCANYEGNKELKIGTGPLLLFPGTKLYERHHHLLNESKIRSLRMYVWYNIRIWKKSLPETEFGLRFLKSFVHNLRFAMRAASEKEYPTLKINEMTIQAIHLSVAQLKMIDCFKDKKAKKIMNEYLSVYTGIVGELL